MTGTMSTTDPDRGHEWAVVTGGSKGIGRGIAERFAAGGVNVVVVARNQDDIDVAVDEMANLPGEVIGMAGDVSDFDAIDALFDQIGDRLPHLNHFVANAGTGAVTPFLELSRDEIDMVVGLNLTGAIYSMQRAANMIVDRPVDNSCLIVVSSIRGLSTMPGRLIYAATKAGVNQAAKTAANELAPHGIRVNILSPGITETPLTARNPEVFAEMAAGVPLGRAGQPTDLASAAWYLCSPEGSFVTGLNMIVDGGESLHR